MKTRYYLFAAAILFTFACSLPAEQLGTPLVKDSTNTEHIRDIETGNTTPMELVNFACSLSGTPYKYGSTDPKEGFDCSGFVTYVFNHFHIKVPRTSTDFTDVHHSVPIKDARLGDLILFTGTDSTTREIGHIGIVSSLPGENLKFLHSTSGKGFGVVETVFNTPYYQSRYVKTIRVFRQNDNIK